MKKDKEQSISICTCMNKAAERKYEQSEKHVRQNCDVARVCYNLFLSLNFYFDKCVSIGFCSPTSWNLECLM